MQRDLSSYRKRYSKNNLSKEQLPKTPMVLFDTWFEEASREVSNSEVNAMMLGTIGIDEYPKSRVVLLKKYSEKGFLFFTNYQSEKGQSIAKNNKVSLSFFWEACERQVIIKGIAKKSDSSESDAYFQSRPRESQLGALTSPQSEVIESREILEFKLSDLENAYKNKTIRRPKFWGGYWVFPKSIEFWQGRPSRLHDRICYSFQDSNWLIERLAP